MRSCFGHNLRGFARALVPQDTAVITHAWSLLANIKAWVAVIISRVLPPAKADEYNIYL